MRASSDFRDAVHGVRAARPTLVVHAQALEEPPSVVGFIVSKAVGGAVVRNRVKRRLRHLVGPLIATDATPLKVVVRALPAAATTPERVGTDLSDAWSTIQRRVAQTARASR